MTKVTLTPVTGTQNQTSLAATLNSNFTALVNAIENTLSRDGTSPNPMDASVDMNSYRIYNLPDALTSTEPITKGFFDTVISQSNNPLTTVLTVNGKYGNVTLTKADLGLTNVENYNVVSMPFTPPGVNGVAATIVSKIAQFVVSSDYSTLADAATAALGKIFFIPANQTVTISSPDVDSLDTIFSNIQHWIPGYQSKVIIQIADGTYNRNTEIIVKHPFGKMISIRSVSGWVDYTYSSLGTVVNTGSGNHTAVFNLSSAAGIDVGDYLKVLSTVGTGNHAKFRGYWKVTNVAGNAVTLKITDFQAAIGSATITSCSIAKASVQIKFTFVSTGQDKFLLRIASQLGDYDMTHLGLFGIGLIGDPTQAATNGIQVGFQSYFYSASSSFAIADFGRNGIWAFRNSTTYTDGIPISGCQSNGFYAIQGSMAEIIRTVATGNTYGIASSGASQIFASQATVAGNSIGGQAGDNATLSIANGTIVGNNTGVQTSNMAWINIVGASTVVTNNVTGVSNSTGGRTLTTSATFSGNTTDIDNGGLGYTDGTGAGAIDSTSTFGIRKVLQGSASLDFAAGTVGVSQDLTITVTGAAVGDPCVVNCSGTPSVNGAYFGFVSAANTVTVRYLAGDITNPVARTWVATVFKVS